MDVVNEKKLTFVTIVDSTYLKINKNHEKNNGE